MERVRIVPGKVSFRAVSEARRASLSSWLGRELHESEYYFQEKEEEGDGLPGRPSCFLSWDLTLAGSFS